MDENPAAAAEDPQDEIIALVRRLQETQRRLQELTGGELDAVTMPGGASYLLHAAQEKLRHNEGALRMRERALAEVSQGVILCNEQRRIVFTNAYFRELTGYREAELAGKNCSILHGPLTDAATVERIRTCLNAGQPFEGEILNYRKDGTTFWNDLSIAPIHGRPGESTAFVGIQRDITARRQAEEAHQRSNALIRIAGRLTRTGGWSMELPGRQVVWSDEVCEIMDGPPGSSLALSAALALHPSPSQDEVSAALEACAREGTPFDLEVEIFTFKGRRIWGHVCGEADRRADGTIRRVWGAFQDITDRKNAEITLRESEESFRHASRQLRKVLDSSLDIISTFDAKGRITQVSAACEKIWGYSPKELLGQAYLDFVLPEDRPKTIQAAREIMAGNSTVSFENRYLRKDGSLAHIMWSASWSDAEQSMFCVARDFTETRQAESETRELAERLKLAVRAGRIGIWDWDIARGTMHWDDQMYELYGAAPGSEAAGVELWQHHLHPDDRERANAAVTEALRPEGRPFDASFRIVMPGGVIRHIRGQGLVFRDPDGHAIRMLGTNWDVTRQVQREEALRQKLESEKTLRAQAAAGEQAKREFLAVMSHEIRTPMNGILGFAEMLTHDAELSAESRGYVETIRGSGAALLHILDDVLDFSRIEAGQLKIEKVAVSPSALIDEITALFSLQIRKKGLDFQPSVAADVPPLVKGDPGRIRQILVNLVGNAVKFTERGEIRLGVRRSEGRLDFFVHDSGSGIAADKIEEVFHAFAQADSSITRQHGGTGLGLTISRRLARLMGGKLNVRSEPGHGSEFSLLIPLELADAAAPIPSTKPPLRAPHSSFPVLVVEDDAVNLKLIVLMLRRLGYDPLTARNGLEAVQIYREARPRCILMDVQMPQMDGIEATRRIRQLEREADAPPTFISALTANILPEDRGRCFEAGMDFFLNKPVNAQAIANLLHEAGRSRD